MSELEQLGRDLRSELGSPTKAWERRQWERLRHEDLVPRRHRRMVLAVALGAALVCLVAGAWFYQAEENPVASSTGVWLTADSMREPYRTKDGSSIALKEHARGRLSTLEGSRRFDLHQGLAHFSVNPAKVPFVVVAGEYEVRVVGTKFSVRYDPPAAMDVEVERGIVRVHLSTSQRSVELRAGDRLSVGKDRFVLEHGEPDASSQAPAASAQPGVVVEREPGPKPSAAIPSEASAEPSLPEWQALHRKGQYRAAFQAAKKLGFDRLLGELGPRQLADLADAARLSGDSTAAIKALETLGRRFPGTALASDAGFLVGRLHAEHGARAQAIQHFEAYLRRGANARYSVEAMGRLVELYSAQGNAAQARTMAKRYLQRAPHGPYQRLARSVLGERQ